MFSWTLQNRSRHAAARWATKNALLAWQRMPPRRMYSQNLPWRTRMAEACVGKRYRESERVVGDETAGKNITTSSVTYLRHHFQELWVSDVTGLVDQIALEIFTLYSTVHSSQCTMMSAAQIRLDNAILAVSVPPNLCLGKGLCDFCSMRSFSDRGTCALYCWHVALPAPTP